MSASTAESLLFALDTAPRDLGDEVDSAFQDYIARQCLLGAILEGEADPSDLLDAIATDLGNREVDQYLLRFNP